MMVGFLDLGPCSVTRVYLSAPVQPPEPANIYGVNLAGGEFGDVYDSAGNRTIYGSGRYYYPSRPQTPATAHDQMDYFWSKGVRLMRLPVKWERIQPALFGPLYYWPDEPFTAINDLDIRRVMEVITYWTGLGGFVLFDLHNYMGYQQRLPDGTVRSNKIRYDSPVGLTVEALSDVWVRLANVFGGNPRVWFGLMNEPSGDGATATRTRDNMHAVVNAIRSRTDALNRVVVAGSSYSNAKKWVSGGVAAAFDAFYDPAGNFAFEPHNYIDPDQSGTQGTCVVQTATNNQLAEFTTWARARGFRGVLGEFAGGNPAVAGQEQCASSVPATYQFMHDNADVWIGWTTWGGGFPTSYPFTLEPSGGYAGNDSPGMKMLRPFLT